MRLFSIKIGQAKEAKSLLLPDTVKAIEKGLPVTAIIAEEDERAVGAAAGIADGDVFRLLSIYVEPEYRKRGIGRALLEKLEEIVAVTGRLIRAEYTAAGEDLEALAPFFLHLGYRDDAQNRPGYYIGKIGNLTEDETIPDLPENFSLSFLDDIGEKTLSDFQKTTEIDFTAGTVLKDVSCAVLMEGTIKAYIVVERVEKKILKVEEIDSEISDHRMLSALVLKTCRKLKKKFDPEVKLVVLVLGDKPSRTLRSVMGDAASCSYSFIK